MDLNESQTRSLLINPLLVEANWKLSDRTQVGFEIPVEGYDPNPWNGITDYCLYRPSGPALIVVEAKRTSRNPREGEEQLRQYVTEIAKKQDFAPFGFMSNGLNTYLGEVGLAHPRLVAGFFTPADLERLLFIRKNRQPLAAGAIRNSIVDRPYQHEAIRRVCEAFDKGKRRALLVMATGTGKTRTVMGLIDLFLQTCQTQKILFVADRDALVEQALNDGFKVHLPHEPRVRIHTANLDKDKRLYVATLQTIGCCFEKFSPGFFDLIIFDEAHRSIFNRFTEVIEYFDARMVGLTATPANFIDRDTFRTFDCREQAPTFLYTYQQAVAEKRLVDFRLYQAQTGFQRNGIRGIELSEEDRNSLLEQGIDPNQIDYSGTDIEVLVSNKDTLRRQWDEIMEHCLHDQGGQLPGKTIVFAMTKDHAERIRDVFEEMYPQHVGLLQVVHHGIERVHDGPYGDGLISKFKKHDKPRFAVSVDMLDTGVDIPEVVNLVFMKPVQSRIKLWQMIGRGTRNHETCKYHSRLPDGQKTEFLIIDFWQNDFGKQTDESVLPEIPVLVRLFNTRLDLPDFVVTKGYLIVNPGQPPVHVEEYRRRVERRIQQIADTHPALTAIREGREPFEEQLVDLERVLHNELTGGEIQLSPDLIRKAYGLRMDNRLGFLGFVRHVLELDTILDYDAVVARGFQSHITSHNYTSDQIRFLRSVQEVFLAKRRLTEDDLYAPPLTNFGRNAVERFFTLAEIKEIVALTDHLTA